EVQIHYSESWVAADPYGVGRVLCLSGGGEDRVYERDMASDNPISESPLDKSLGQYSGDVEVLAPNRALLASSEGLMLIEKQTRWAVAWQVKRTHIAHAAFWRNDRLLVVSNSPVPRLCEVTKTGATVWETLLDDQGVRCCPCLRLVAFGFDREPPPSLNLEAFSLQRQWLSHPDPRRRVRAAAALRAMRPAATPATDELVAALGDPEDWVRNHAEQTLIDIGEHALPRLLEALRSKNRRMQRASAYVLCYLGPRAKPAVPSLMDLLGSDDKQVRHVAFV